jgi:hypothetical protein
LLKKQKANRNKEAELKEEIKKIKEERFDKQYAYERKKPIIDNS